VSDELRGQLKELLAQWRETARVYGGDFLGAPTTPSMRAASGGYRECIDELEKVLAGDLSPIERM